MFAIPPTDRLAPEALVSAIKERGFAQHNPARLNQRLQDTKRLLDSVQPIAGLLPAEGSRATGFATIKNCGSVDK
jgi:hypothetical protein